MIGDLKNLLAGRHIGPGDLRPDGNSFTLLRWILASTVMFSHAYDLTMPAMRGNDPSVALFGFPVSRLAVFLFFSLSGFLVTGSLVKRGILPFVIARALRLIPGLWVMLLVLPVLLWAVFGTTPFGEFATDPMTRRFVWRNAVLIGGAYHLPGIFVDLPFPQLVAGSIWTIPEEVRCYLALALLGGLRLLKPRWRLTALFAAGTIVHLAVPIDFIPALVYPRQLAFAFFLGALAYQWRDRLLLSWPLAAVLAGAALLVPAESRFAAPLVQTGFAYLVLVAAMRLAAPVRRFSAAMPDYSYGIYIWAFPMQQAAIPLGADGPLANIALAFALTLPLAALSWHFVEAPALALKDRFTRTA